MLLGCRNQVRVLKLTVTVVIPSSDNRQSFMEGANKVCKGLLGQFSSLTLNDI